MGLVLPADDVMGITDRVQRGDPTLGWRGDPAMDVYAHGNSVAVYGFDRKGERYVAATVSKVSQGWRHELLRKLRDGDWQDPHAYDRTVAAQVKDDKARDDRLAERRMELAERFAFAAMKDNGIKRFY